MLDALIFDLDGTLLDSNSLHAKAFVKAFEDSGFTIPEGRILPEIGKGADKLITSILGDEAAGAHGDALKKGHMKHVLALIKERGVEKLPGSVELLKRVRETGLKIAIATAAESEVRDALADAAGLDLEKLADVIVTDTDVENSKPAPDTVEAAIKKLGLAPGVCGFVGDTPYDAQASYRAGIAAVAIANPAHSAQEMRQSGMRARYDHPATLLAHLGEALETLSPGPARLTNTVLEALMQEALAEARKGSEKGEIPIGAVVARYDGTVVGRGHNQAKSAGSPVAHAEIRALQAAVYPENARDLVLVTTLEPCVMCMGAALEARIDTIVYAHPAPENSGIERVEPVEVPESVWPRVIRGVCLSESRGLLQHYAQAYPEAGFVQRLLAQTQ